ncbi:hypothetical protein [Neptunomonas sp.]|uniref:hypothetical protein n=1 Tax=Neptunomonas sp. TaxID=1971898 RepID=UPI0035614A55
MDQENQLVIAATCGKEFINAYNGKRTKAIHILDKIFIAILNKYDPPHESFSFDSNDFMDDEKDNESGGAYRVAMGKIHKTLDSHEAFLNQVSVDLKLSFIPKIQCVNEGQGKGPKAFKVIAVTANAMGITSVDQVPNGYIRYTIEEEAEPTSLGKLIDGLTTTGYRLHLIVSFMLLSIIIGTIVVVGGYFILSKVTSVLDFLKGGLGLIAITYGLYSLINPIYQCITKRIIICPSILSPMSAPSAQLQYTTTHTKRQSGRKNRQFKVIVYTATCPICQSRIDIYNGTNQLSGRLVGLCDENPREHVFSFDYTTRLGKPVF